MRFKDFYYDDSDKGNSTYNYYISNKMCCSKLYDTQSVRNTVKPIVANIIILSSMILFVVTSQ